MKFSRTLSFFLQFFLLRVIMNFANPASYKNISRSTINSIINGIPSAPRHFYSRLIFGRGNLNDVYYTTSYVPYLFPQFVGAGGQMWMRWGGRAKSGCVGVGVGVGGGGGAIWMREGGGGSVLDICVWVANLETRGGRQYKRFRGLNSH